MTTKKETENIMKEANLTRNQRIKIRKQLLLGNGVVRETREAKKKTPASKKRSLHRIISGQIFASLGSDKLPNFADINLLQ